MAAGDEVKVKIGISYTSIENARKNLEAECAALGFRPGQKRSHAVSGTSGSEGSTSRAARRRRASSSTPIFGMCSWDGTRSTTSAETIPGTWARRTPRASCRLSSSEFRLDEAGKPKHHMYNSDALWLTMWNLNILWGLGWPEMLDEFSASMIEYAEVGGHLPRGPCAGGYTGIMTGLSRHQPDHRDLAEGPADQGG